MNLSNTSQYAIRVLCFMAMEEDKVYSASFLISTLKVSDKYLKRILTKLSESGILLSIQGRYGGFKLAKSTDKTALIEIVEAMETVEKYFGCVLGFDECSDENPCSLHTKWAPIKEKLLSFLQNTNLSDVLKEPAIIKY